MAIVRPPFPLVWDPEDTWLLDKYTWHLNNAGYASAGGLRLFHRMVMNAQTGQEVKHINHNKLDCRKANLAFCTRAENQQERWDIVKPAERFSRLNTSGIVGVCFDNRSKRWRAYTTLPQRSLGFHSHLFEAACARKSWENHNG